MNESPTFSRSRKKLVEGLRKKGITDERALEAIGKVPRHVFIDNSLASLAYEDRPLPIGNRQTISQPFTVAFQTQLLHLHKGEKVLEIGTGSGYQAAVLVEMEAEVYTIERQYNLYLKARDTLHGLAYEPHIFFGDGYEGKPDLAPFNKILITAAAERVPEKLLQQLAIGGRLVMPVGDSLRQVMTVVERVDQEKYHTTHHGDFIFVPMLGGVVQVANEA